MEGVKEKEFSKPATGNLQLATYILQLATFFLIIS